MVTERELLKAIQECERDPITYNNIEKLANLYTVYDHLFGEHYEPSERTTEKSIISESNSEFSRKIRGKNSEKVWAVIDELMQTIKVINPRLYDAVLERIDE